MKEIFIDWKNGFDLSDNDMEQLATNIEIDRYGCTSEDYNKIQEQAKRKGLI